MLFALASLHSYDSADCMKVANLLLIALFAFSADGSSMGPRDSIDIMVAGGASVGFQKSSGAKAEEDGLLRASLTHEFSSIAAAVISLRGGRNLSVPLFEEGRVSLKFGNSEISGGFLSNRFGFTTLYRPTSVFYFLFDRALLWDVNGFGVGGNLECGRGIALGAGSSLNSRESGQAHAFFDYSGLYLQTRILAGFRSYSPDDQDNSFSVGTEIAGQWKFLKVHAIGKIMRYSGFGHATNKTMVPGKSISGLFETRIDPNEKFNAAAQVYYENYEKRFRHEFLLTGVEGVWMALTRCGIGAGFERQMDDAYATWMPRIFFIFVPFAKKTDLRFSLQQSTLAGSRPVYSLFGEVRIEF